MATVDQQAAVREAVTSEFGSRLTPEQIDAEVVRALDDLHDAITEYSLVPAATDLCRQRCAALLRASEPLP